MLADRIRASTGGGVLSFTYVDAATSTSASLSAPGGIASGDLAIFMDVAMDDPSSPSAVTPSGFTNFFNQSATQGANDKGIRVMISRKLLAGTETTLTGMNGGESNHKLMLVYRPSRAIDTVTPLSPFKYTINSSSNPSSQTTSMSSLTDPVVFIALTFGGTAAGSFTTASPSFDATHTVGTNAVFGRKLYNTAHQNHTVDMDDTGHNNTLVSGYITAS